MAECGGAQAYTNPRLTLRVLRRCYPKFLLFLLARNRLCSSRPLVLLMATLSHLIIELLLLIKLILKFKGD